MTNKQQLALGYFKEVRLAPTPLTLDVWVCSDTQALVPKFIQRYGELEEDGKRWGDADGIVPNGVLRITTGTAGEIPYTYKMIMVLDRFDPQTIVHESTHVLLRLSERVGLQIAGADEWCAYFQDYLFELITDVGSYNRLCK